MVNEKRESAPEDLFPSTPDLKALDDGWFDDDDEEEAELPDEAADPEAYAAAKKARDERRAARRAKKKAKFESKRQRQLAKAAEARAKQKSKSKARPKAGERHSKPDESAGIADAMAEDAPRIVSAPARKRVPSRSSTQWKVLALVAVAVVLLLAAVLTQFR